MQVASAGIKLRYSKTRDFLASFCPTQSSAPPPIFNQCCHLPPAQLLPRTHTPTHEITMCFYHAYSHRCGHTQMVLQQLCPKGQMKQQKCARGQDGTILATVKVETPCSVCPNRSEDIRDLSLAQNHYTIYNPGRCATTIHTSRRPSSLCFYSKEK
ncbi:hypothetical protein HBI62_045760 [Parastagonospora nodorum]|nr:hypothetical protein HBH72_134370 [Parastagonospora nodorum]KAH5124609.1 hypothetical protein HBH71_019020 [Parastagonospora nodorum]KAH5233726.1 hypothetical protein HBI62_045760 [Parastagonospora nodorum]KAH5534526.1 hypothetical protein HBI27_186080 [Parastagonospora nodorum]KAH5775093.1 hypothetical protein HBI16_099870 [Parastagonospora nodorum]